MTATPRKRSDVKWKQLGKTGILLDLRTGDYFEVDEIALAIWRMLDGKSSVDQLVDKLTKRYAASPKTIEKDVTQFIAELKKRKLIEK